MKKDVVLEILKVVISAVVSILTVLGIVSCGTLKLDFDCKGEYCYSKN